MAERACSVGVVPAAGRIQIGASTAEAPIEVPVPFAAHGCDRKTCGKDVENSLGTFESMPGKFVRQISDDAINAWKIDGSNGHYHSKSSLCLVIWAQILYIVSLVIIIPTASRYATSLGAEGTIYFGIIVGISSIVDPLVCRLWTSVIKVASLKSVLLTNAVINVSCSLMYVLANCAGTNGGVMVLIASRCILGFGSVQTAYLQYLGRAVSTKRVTFAHFLTTASVSYGFAFGVVLAFLISLVAFHRNWNQNLSPGWFTAILWLLYIPMHCQFFVEPDQQAGIVDPESKIRLTKEMRPKLRREPFGGLLPCLFAIFVIAVVKGAFEVMTIDVTRQIWNLHVMNSALFLGGVMFIVALTTLLAYMMQTRVGESRIFLYGLVGATALLPVYYIPVSGLLPDAMHSTGGMICYLLTSIVMLSFFNIGRTIAFSLTTELPSPQWRDYFLAHGSSLFTMGRGVGPILVGVFERRQITFLALLVGCVMATMSVCWAYSRGKLEHDEHEVGPARAEEEDSLHNRISKWLDWHGIERVDGFQARDFSRCQDVQCNEHFQAGASSNDSYGVESDSSGSTHTAEVGDGIPKLEEWVFG